MSVYQRTYRDKNSGELVKCEVYTYDFIFNGQRYKGSTECTGKTRAKAFEKDMKERLERALAGLPTDKPETRIRTVAVALSDYEEHYAVDHAPKSVFIVRDRGNHLRRLLGNEIAAALTETRIQEYRKTRLKEGAGPRTIDLELSVLSRAFGAKWSSMWPRLKKLDKGSQAGKVMEADTEQSILERARVSRSPYLYPYLMIQFNTGMRPGEARILQWDRFVFGTSHESSYVRVGKSKTKAGEHRAVAMEYSLWKALVDYRDWYEKKLGKIRPDWYVFPFGQKSLDPRRPITSLKKAWQTLKTNLKLDYRLHDTRHTFATSLAVAGVSEAKRRYLMGHVDEEVINRYTHLKAEDCRADVERARAARRTLKAVPPVSTPVTADSRKEVAG